MLERLRRVWIALPGADPELKAAASDGVILTCVTQARRRGVWTLPATERHVAVPAHSAHIEAAGHLHWGAPVVPRHPHALVDPIENVLCLAATCQPFETALAMWESAIRHELVSTSALATLPLPARARALLDAATPFADSGLETIFRIRLAWLRVPIRIQIWISGHRVDTLVGDRLIVQIDGGHHVGAQRTSDIRHDAELMLMGYHVIRVGYEQIIHRWHEVQDLVMGAIARGLHQAGE
ncbi:endonuclease domain-containing protein [Microbacterium terricola]|nr:DUF559 domain-containing protein [Microbacterium terricola]UYK41454.1 DUF559 domain-containing protein [Microbacterium terricola]